MVLETTSSVLAVQPLTESGHGLLRMRANITRRFPTVVDDCPLRRPSLSQVVLNMDHPLKCKTLSLVEALPSILNHQGLQLP